jgi:hypothetical protein
MEIFLCPEWLFAWMERRGVADERARVHLGYLISNLLVLGLLPLAYLVPHFCIFRSLTGMPCPGCGVTHAIMLALALDVRGSLLANPAGLLITAAIFFQLCFRPLAIVFERTSPFVVTGSRWLAKFAVLTLFASWIFTLLHLHFS